MNSPESDTSVFTLIAEGFGYAKKNFLLIAAVVAFGIVSGLLFAQTIPSRAPYFLTTLRLKCDGCGFGKQRQEYQHELTEILLTPKHLKSFLEDVLRVGSNQSSDRETTFVSPSAYLNQKFYSLPPDLRPFSVSLTGASSVSFAFRTENQIDISGLCQRVVSSVNEILSIEMRERFDKSEFRKFLELDREIFALQSEFLDELRKAKIPQVDSPPPNRGLFRPEKGLKSSQIRGLINELKALGRSLTILEKSGVKLERTASLREALKIIEKETFSLVASDLDWERGAIFSPFFFDSGSCNEYSNQNHNLEVLDSLLIKKQAIAVAVFILVFSSLALVLVWIKETIGFGRR